MNILDFTFDNWYTLVLKLNWLAVVIIIVMIFAMACLWDKCIKYYE